MKIIYDPNEHLLYSSMYDFLVYLVHMNEVECKGQEEPVETEPSAAIAWQIWELWMKITFVGSR